MFVRCRFLFQSTESRIVNATKRKKGLEKKKYQSLFVVQERTGSIRMKDKDWQRVIVRECILWKE